MVYEIVWEVNCCCMSFSLFTVPDPQTPQSNSYPGFLNNNFDLVQDSGLDMSQRGLKVPNGGESRGFGGANLSDIAGEAASKALKMEGGRHLFKGSEGSFHSYSPEERRSFVEFVNLTLGSDQDLSGDLPIDPESDEAIFRVIGKGLLLPKLINLIEPGSIGDVVIKPDLNSFEKRSNHTATIEAARKMGCYIINIDESDILEGRPHLVLGMVWQLLNKVLLNKVTVKYHPELLTLLKNEDDIEKFIKREPQENLRNWVNYHLERAGFGHKMENFKEDLRDGQVYLHLLGQISPSSASAEVRRFIDENGFTGGRRTWNEDEFNEKNLELMNVLKFVCHFSREQLRVFGFLSWRGIMDCNETLNLAFLSNLFHQYPALVVNNDQIRVEDMIRERLKSKEIEQDDQKLAHLLAQVGVDQDRRGQDHNYGMLSGFEAPVVAPPAVEVSNVGGNYGLDSSAMGRSDGEEDRNYPVANFQGCNVPIDAGVGLYGDGGGGQSFQNGERYSGPSGVAAGERGADASGYGSYAQGASNFRGDGQWQQSMPYPPSYAMSSSDYQRQCTNNQIYQDMLNKNGYYNQAQRNQQYQTTGMPPFQQSSHLMMPLQGKNGDYPVQLPPSAPFYGEYAHQNAGYSQFSGQGGQQWGAAAGQFNSSVMNVVPQEQVFTTTVISETEVMDPNVVFFIEH